MLVIWPEVAQMLVVDHHAHLLHRGRMRGLEHGVLVSGAQLVAGAFGVGAGEGPHVAIVDIDAVHQYGVCTPGIRLPLTVAACTIWFCRTVAEKAMRLTMVGEKFLALMP